MRDLLKRLDRLEQATKPEAKPFRVCIQLIGAKDGQALAWNPTWAGRNRDDERMDREPGESIEAFEARADKQFPVGRYMIGA